MAPRAQGDAIEAFGRYRLLEPIGRGGMAEVFKAKSFGVEGFEKVLVIKRILPELAKHQAFVDMFVGEAKLAVRLSHANIVQVFDLGRIDAPGGTSYFIAMEYVPGVDLATLLAQRRRLRQPLAPALAVFVATEVAKALDHAHRRRDESQRPLGIVHRDISPHNVLVSWEGDVKVTDFGIAKARDIIPLDEETAADELSATRAAGKLSYLSPEQARGDATDARSDLFSLGSVLYEMLTGASPFRGGSRSETVRRILSCEYPPLELGCSEAPPELGKIVARLLQPDAGARYQSAGELCERLLEYCYATGARSGAAELCDALAPLHDATETTEIEGSSVLDEPSAADDLTPVEIPHAPTVPPHDPGTLPVSVRGERREVSLVVVSCADDENDAALERVCELLERHGAWTHERSASQVVAIFGLGDTDGRDADAAVRAALVTVRERRAGVVPSAGVHCGTISVDAGGMPVADERLGSLLATAQALARASEGRVALSPVVGRLVRRVFVTEPLPNTRRHATDGGVVVKSGQPSERPGTRFVGRHDELKQLGGILAAATRQVPQFVVVRGETGVGKSRLLLEARRRLERGQFNVAFYTATCPPNGATVPWSALRGMLHVLCGTQEDDDASRILEVAPRLRALGLAEAEVGGILQLLGAHTRTPASETPAALRAGFEHAVQSLCRDRVHCFSWDDAHAMDAESLRAILRVLGKGIAPAPTGASGSLRAVFILAQRGDLLPLLGEVAGLHEIELGDLGARETARLVAAELGVAVVPPELVSHVRSCAGGHPLFVEELLRELVENGELRVLSGRVAAVPGNGLATAPRTLRNLVASRVSRLPERERRILQVVAILGEPADTAIVAAVVQRSLPSLDRLVATLARRGLLRRVGPSKVRFASPLYREIVLDAMAPMTRQQLHSDAAGVYMESRFGDGGETAERVGHHLLAAGERRLAVDYLWQSAEEKLENGELEGALRGMQRTLDLADLFARTPTEIAAWLSKLAETASSVRVAPGLHEAVLPALRQVQARGDAPTRVRACIDAARALGAVNRFDDAYRALDEVPPEAIVDPEAQRAALATEMEVSLRKGLFTRASQAADRYEVLAPVDDVTGLLLLAQVRCSTGRCDRALALMDRADALARPGDLLDEVARQKHRTLIHFNSRDFLAVAREAGKLADLARTAGLRFEAAAALHNLGDAADRVGDRGRSYAAFVESNEFTRALEHERLTNLNLMHLCLLEGLKGSGTAESELKAHIRTADGNGFVWDVLEGRYLLARLCAFRGDVAAARTLLERVRELAREHGHELILQDADELLATLEI